MNARREAYEDMVNSQAVRHREQLVDRWRQQQLVDAMHAADETSEDTFVLSNGIANKYIYI